MANKFEVEVEVLAAVSHLKKTHARHQKSTNSTKQNIIVDYYAIGGACAFTVIMTDVLTNVHLKFNTMTGQYGQPRESILPANHSGLKRIPRSYCYLLRHINSLLKEI